MRTGECRAWTRCIIPEMQMAGSGRVPARRSLVDMRASSDTDLHRRCELLRSLHRPGAPLLLPNAWDVATARAVAGAGFPVVATTSVGVAAALGHEDHERA